MDAEKLAQFKNRVANLSDSSVVGEFQGLVTLLCDLYIGELPETLSGGALTTEIGLVITDRDALIAEFNARTDQVKK